MTGASAGRCWAYRMRGVSLEDADAQLALAGIDPAGLSEEDGIATAWFVEQPAGLLPVSGDWEQIAAEDWSTRWREWISPLQVGAIRIVPPWLADDDDHRAATTLIIEPGMAFGTGHHETTAGCLAALQERSLDGLRVADVGTGTAVLALAAERLGAAEVVAVDIDPLAIEVAAGNVAAHGSAVRLAVGSCEAVDGPADVVVANLTTDTILSLLDQLVAVVADGGRLILSGVSAERSPRVVEALRQRLDDVEVRHGTEWSVITADRLT